MARWDDLGVTQEQFYAVLRSFTERTPNAVMTWWFWGDAGPREAPPWEIWKEILQPFYPKEK